MTTQKNRVRVVVLEVDGDGATVSETIAHAFRLWELESRQPEDLRELTPDTASVDCPRCGATVGQQCRNDEGGFHVARVHAERWGAALGDFQKRSPRS